jgi:hypothetical protein
MKIIEIIQEDGMIDAVTKAPIYSIFRALGIAYLLDNLNRERDKLRADLDKFKQLNGKVDAGNKFYNDKTIEKAQAHYDQLIRELVTHARNEAVVFIFADLVRFLVIVQANFQKMSPFKLNKKIGTFIRFLLFLAEMSTAAAITLIETNKDTLGAAFDLAFYTWIDSPSLSSINHFINVVDTFLAYFNVTKKDQVNNAFSIPTDPNDPMANAYKPSTRPRLGKYPITDKNGFLTLEPAFWSDTSTWRLINQSIESGNGNPLDKHPKLPGKIYPTWNSNLEQYIIPYGFATQWDEFVADRDKK